MEAPEIKGLRPKATRDSKPYWDGLLEGRLLIQQCGNCGAFRHYPRPVCPDCYSMDVKWREMQGQGIVHTWTVSHHAFHHAYKKHLPTVYVTVELPEGPRMVGRLVDGDATDMSVGRDVTLGVEMVDDELALPIVRVA